MEIVLLITMLVMQGPADALAAAHAADTAAAAAAARRLEQLPAAAAAQPDTLANRRQLQPIWQQSAPIYTEAQAEAQVRVAAVPRPARAYTPPPAPRGWGGGGWNGRKLRSLRSPLLSRRQLSARAASGRCVCAFDFDNTLRVERDGRQDAPAGDAGGIIADCQVRWGVWGWGWVWV